MAKLDDWTDGSLDSPLYVVSPPALAMGISVEHLLDCLDRVLPATPGRGPLHRRRHRAAVSLCRLLADLAMLDRPLGERFQRITGEPFAEFVPRHAEPITDALALLAKAEAPVDALVGPKSRPAAKALLAKAT